MTEISKNCCVRLPGELHRLAKLKAYEQGITLQEYMINLIKTDLKIQFFLKGQK